MTEQQRAGKVLSAQTHEHLDRIEQHLRNGLDAIQALRDSAANEPPDSPITQEPGDRAHELERMRMRADVAEREVPLG